MSLLISEHIYNKLLASEELTGLVDDKIFTISTKAATSFPFVAFKRSSLTPNYTKDRHSTGDNVAVEFIVASDNYLISVMIASKIRKALEGNRGSYEEFDVIDAKLASADEDFIEETFIQRLVFSFETE